MATLRSTGPISQLADLINRNDKNPLVSVRDLHGIPGLLQQTYDLPEPEFRALRSPANIRREDVTGVLALSFFETVPKEVLKTDLWKFISHQCAGVCCTHVSMVSVLLRPSKDLENAFLDIAQHFFGTDLGRARPLLDELFYYRNALNAVGLDCNQTHHRLMEGIYPADYSADFLAKAAPDSAALSLLITDKYWWTPTLTFLAVNSD